MALPAWLQPLLDAPGQRALDEWAIERCGVPSLRLMENAGTALADAAGQRAPRGRIVVVCGKGNNGGDGLVAARALRELGRDVDVRLIGSAGELQGDALANLQLLPGRAPEPFARDALGGAGGIIDAILGTGFAGEPRDPAASAIAAVADAAAHGTAVVACDVPSGVDASTGEAGGAAVDADLTVTFHAAKPGLWIAPGKARAGDVVVAPIGIPDPRMSPGSDRLPPEPELGLIDGAVLAALPRRGVDATKFSAGSVLVCGGAAGLTGAPCLAAEAAARAGAGYVTACVPGSLSIVFESRLLEVMTVALPDEHGALRPAAADIVLERADRADALVLGPGLGRSPGAQALARHLASELALPLLLDADGLNAHAGRLEELAGRSGPTVLTPHAGELARLLGTTSADVEAQRLRCVRRAAAVADAVVVLKGDDTLVAHPSGHVAISRGGVPALATAGTGDVLSGTIGAALAKRLDPFTAACAGVHVHLLAGRLASAENGVEGMIASDVIARLPAALASTA